MRARAGKRHRQNYVMKGEAAGPSRRWTGRRKKGRRMASAGRLLFGIDGSGESVGQLQAPVVADLALKVPRDGPTSHEHDPGRRTPSLPKKNNLDRPKANKAARGRFPCPARPYPYQAGQMAKPGSFRPAKLRAAARYYSREKNAPSRESACLLPADRCAHEARHPTRPLAIPFHSPTIAASQVGGEPRSLSCNDPPSETFVQQPPATESRR